MSYKKEIPEMPSFKEAAVIATIFDETGHFEDAAVMDEFIKSASQQSDLEKQAGLWSGIWNRLGGWAKKVFFKEYKELHKTAKEANEKISERIEEVESLWKEATSDFKNYELVAWREKVLRLPVYTKDLMVDYEKAFGRLVAFTYKLQDKENKKEDNEMTPPGEGGEGKPWGGPEEKKEMDGKPEELEDPWYHPTGVSSIMEDGQSGELAMDQKRFNRSRKWGQIVYVDKDKGLVRFNPKYKGKPAKGLKEVLGDDVWQIQRSSGGWIYLAKKESGDKEDSEIEFLDSKSTPDVPGDPSLPASVKNPGDLLKENPEDISEEDILEERTLEEEPPDMPEDASEEDISEEDILEDKSLGEIPENIPEMPEDLEEEMSKEDILEEPMDVSKEMSKEDPEDISEEEPVEVPEGKWAVYLSGKNRGKVGLFKRIDPRYHLEVKDEDKKKKLNELHSKMNKVPQEAKDAGSSIISDLIDSIVNKEDMSRTARMNRISLLSKK